MHAQFEPCMYKKLVLYLQEAVTLQLWALLRCQNSKRLAQAHVPRQEHLAHRWLAARKAKHFVLITRNRSSSGHSSHSTHRLEALLNQMEGQFHCDQAPSPLRDPLENRMQMIDTSSTFTNFSFRDDKNKQMLIIAGQQSACQSRHRTLPP